MTTWAKLRLRALLRRLGLAAPPPGPDARERAAEAKRRAKPQSFPAPPTAAPDAVPDPDEATPTQRLPRVGPDDVTQRLPGGSGRRR